MSHPSGGWVLETHFSVQPLGQDFDWRLRLRPKLNNKSWTSLKQVMNKSWTSPSHEKVMKKSLRSLVQVMNKSWTSHDQVMNKSWKSHEQELYFNYLNFLNFLLFRVGVWCMVGVWWITTAVIIRPSHYLHMICPQLVYELFILFSWLVHVLFVTYSKIFMTVGS